MPNRIQEDWYEFRRVIGGKIREELKKYIKTGQILRARGKGGKIGIPVPRIDLPHIVHGKPGEGVGRGEGNEGDIVGQDPVKGPGDKAGEDPGEGMIVQIDLEYILKLLRDELQLPNLKPKNNPTYEEIKVVYNGISKVGPRSLLHKKRTMRETMKRLAAQGKLKDTVLLPGMTESVPLLLPINDDRRYRQWNEIKKPSSNAVVFFMRDGSGSMDNFKCEIVSDMAWWIDLWIRSFYKRTETVYIWHDTEAKEVSQDIFYNLRYGGGTSCSSALKRVSKLIQPKGRYDPQKWNIYCFYFGDGENSTGDNPVFSKLLKTELGPDKVNLFGITQILSTWSYDSTLKSHIDKQLSAGKLYADHVRTTSINRPEGVPSWEMPKDEARDEAVKKAIKELLGKDTGKKGVTIEEVLG